LSEKYGRPVEIQKPAQETLSGSTSLHLVELEREIL
jgi:hypothetical protein